MNPRAKALGIVIIALLVGFGYFLWSDKYDDKQLSKIEQVTTQTWLSYKDIMSDRNTSSKEKAKRLSKLLSESKLLETAYKFEEIEKDVAPEYKAQFAFVNRYVQAVGGVINERLLLLNAYEKGMQNHPLAQSAKGKILQDEKEAEMLYRQATTSDSAKQAVSEPAAISRQSTTKGLKPGTLKPEDMILGGVRVGINKLDDAKAILGDSPRVTSLKENTPDGIIDTGALIYKSDNGKGGVQVIAYCKDNANGLILQTIITTPQIATSRGIKVGEGVEKIIGAYGEPLLVSNKPDGVTWYRYSVEDSDKIKDRLTFMVSNSKIISIVNSRLPFGP